MRKAPLACLVFLVPALAAAQEPQFGAIAADAAFLKALKPGSLVYFKNPGAESPWHGENAVFLGVEGGERQYFAHPFGKIGEAALIVRLNKEKQDKSRESAYMHQGTTRVTSKLASMMP